MWRAASWRQEPRLDVKVAALSKQRMMNDLSGLLRSSALSVPTSSLRAGRAA